uniref:F-box/kelch-repeat protein At3g23880-like n=1 Tax=Nicotiana tabacum TaxID=4097 RepID=A0A1S4ADR6_TOBAC|nr:PREDICTED: F-box/kelch-repeat protein At3g23880-like [Nicotiana tabacum]
MVTEQIYHYSLDAPSLQHDSVVSLLKPPTISESSWGGKVYVNSCSGLFVLALSPYNIVLWNPTIRESRKIPSPISIHGEEQSHTFYGLGYDSPSSKDDYKIVRLGLIYHPDGHDVQIFSTKSDSWKLIGHRDLLMEKPNLFTVEGCLCLTKFSSLINELADFEVWRMKKNGTMSYSWSKVLAITVPVPDDNWLCTRIHVLPVSFMKDGGILFRRSKAELLFYDPKTQKFEEVKIVGLEALLYLYGAVTYVETLISPNAL